MRGSRVTGIVALVAALHVAVLSLVFGPRHMSYALAAALSATLIWGGVLLLRERKRQAGFIAGLCGPGGAASGVSSLEGATARLLVAAGAVWSGAIPCRLPGESYRGWMAPAGTALFWVPYVMAFCCAQVVLVTLWHLLHPGKPLIKP